MNGAAPQELGQLLIIELVDACRSEAMGTGEPLKTVLERRSNLAPDAFTRELGVLFEYPVLSMIDLQNLNPNFDWISYANCLDRGVLAAGDEHKDHFLAISDPFDAATEIWARHKIPEPCTVVLANTADLAACLAQHEGRMRALADIVGEEGASVEVVDEISLARINTDVSPVVKVVNSTIYDALKLQASDIHLEFDASSLIVKYRIDGVLVHAGQVHGQDMAEQIISRIKVMAELDIAERRVPQDGRFKVRVSGREIDFRVSVMPSIFGEDAVLRLLDRRALTEEAQSLRLESLGLDPEDRAAIRRLASRPHGMLLVTGPTGSGKTTTLYAALTEINTGRDKVVTIEDPVEYRLPRVLQIPVNEKKGLTFARGLRSILRHDPDKIMVGEIRDDETAQIAVQAALTGHLVFTTVHANSVFDVLGRFLHMGVDPYSFSAALNGIVAQRLIRLNCTACVTDVEPDLDDLKIAGLEVDEVRSWKFMAGKGCGHCRGTGYKGRRAVAEVLVLNDRMRELISLKAPSSQLKDEARVAGMRDLRTSALTWVARGDTTLSELCRVAG